ncbi:hypothetical protein [Bacillus sp. JJ722]|uniref:hypothetical protein n=1 Tax=Bacillus sp. JJ722 TaxID=3122973 RepID=UPI002FFDFFCD
MAADKISVRIDVDVSEALTGLKALQREAKKASKELRELERSSQALRELETMGVRIDGPKLGAGELAHIAELREGDLILPRKQAEQYVQVKRPNSLGPIKAHTEGHSDVGEISRKLVEKIRECMGGADE